MVRVVVRLELMVRFRGVLCPQKVALILFRCSVS